VGQTRASAEAADAQNLASASFQSAVALQGEALELSKSGRLVDAAGRLVEANGIFRLAEAEARLRAIARNRPPVADAPTPVPPRAPAELREAPASAPVASAPTPAPRSPAEPRAAPAPSPVASASTPPPRASAEPREAPAPPAGSSRVESRAPAPAPVPRATVDAQDAVRQVIAQYVHGLENRSVADLKRVWPSLSGSQEKAIQAEFNNARSVTAAFNDLQIAINGDTSTVAGVRTYAVVTQDGHKLSRSTKTTLTLRRSGDAWLIERVVHQYGAFHLQ